MSSLVSHGFGVGWGRLSLPGCHFSPVPWGVRLWPTACSSLYIFHLTSVALAMNSMPNLALKFQTLIIIHLNKSGYPADQAVPIIFICLPAKKPFFFPPTFPNTFNSFYISIISLRPDPLILAPHNLSIITILHISPPKCFFLWPSISFRLLSPLVWKTMPVT